MYENVTYNEILNRMMLGSAISWTKERDRLYGTRIRLRRWK